MAPFGNKAKEKSGSHKHKSGKSSNGAQNTSQPKNQPTSSNGQSTCPLPKRMHRPHSYAADKSGHTLTMTADGFPDNLDPKDRNKLFSVIKAHRPGKSATQELASPINAIVCKLAEPNEQDMVHVQGYYENEIEGFIPATKLKMLPASAFLIAPSSTPHRPSSPIYPLYSSTPQTAGSADFGDAEELESPFTDAFEILEEHSEIRDPFDDDSYVVSRPNDTGSAGVSSRIQLGDEQDSDSDASSIDGAPHGQRRLPGSFDGASERKAIVKDGPDFVQGKAAPAEDRAAVKDRFKAKLRALQAARGAIDQEGKPVRSRSELMEARKAKQDRQTVRRKEAKAKAKQEALNNVDVEASRLVGGFGKSGRVGPGAQGASDMPMNLTFGRMETDELATNKRKKRDIKGQLTVMEARDRRLKGYDADKRKHIEDKDSWKAAEAHISGEKIRDDTGKLRKTIKRKEQRKKRSEKEWKKREEGVRVGIKARQKKREDNLKKRRPGFEGTFKIPKRRM